MLQYIYCICDHFSPAVSKAILAPFSRPGTCPLHEQLLYSVAQLCTITTKVQQLHVHWIGVPMPPTDELTRISCVKTLVEHVTLRDILQLRLFGSKSISNGL